MTHIPHHNVRLIAVDDEPLIRATYARLFSLTRFLVNNDTFETYNQESLLQEKLKDTKNNTSKNVEIYSFDVIPFSSAESVLEFYAQRKEDKTAHRYRMILTDLDMGRLSGLDLLEHLEEDPELPRVAAALITGYPKGITQKESYFEYRNKALPNLKKILEKPVPIHTIQKTVMQMYLDHIRDEALQ
ncbi:MAG: hypothetical protein ACMXYK_02540 [Candidatus Woesearchaeota archaeon]